MGAMERQLARVAGIIGGREAAISRRRLGGLAASVAVLGPIAGAGGKKKKEKKKKSQPPQPRNRFRFVTTWGVFGTGNGELNFPMGVAVDSAGNVFVLDTNNDRIQRFEQADEDPLQYDSVTTRGGPASRKASRLTAPATSMWPPPKTTEFASSTATGPDSGSLEPSASTQANSTNRPMSR